MRKIRNISGSHLMYLVLGLKPARFFRQKEATL